MVDIEHPAVPIDIRGGFIVTKKKSYQTFLIRFHDFYTLTRGPNYIINII